MHSCSILKESLDEDEFNNSAAGCVRTNHSVFFLWVFNQPCPSQLPVRLFPMFLCPLGESDKDLLTAWYSLCSQTGEKSGCKLSVLQRFPVLPFPYNPQHTHLNVCFLKSHCPHLQSHPSSISAPPLIPPSAPLLSLNSRRMLQDRDQSSWWFTGRPYCFTASLTGPADPDSLQDVSPGWLARSLRICLLDWLIGQLFDIIFTRQSHSEQTLKLDYITPKLWNNLFLS